MVVLDLSLYECLDLMAYDKVRSTDSVCRLSSFKVAVQFFQLDLLKC